MSAPSSVGGGGGDGVSRQRSRRAGPATSAGGDVPARTWRPAGDAGSDGLRRVELFFRMPRASPWLLQGDPDGDSSVEHDRLRDKAPAPALAAVGQDDRRMRRMRATTIASDRWNPKSHAHISSRVAARK